MKKIAYILCLGILFAGCDNSKIDKETFSTQSNISQEEIKKAQNLDEASYKGLEHIFSNTSEISSNGKFVILIFGKNNCQWCDRLKDDIKEDKSTQELLKKDFKSYYINLSYEKTHNVDFEGKKEKVNSATLASQYNIRPTPTIVFLDKSGKPIVIYPGYLSQVQFKVFLDFIASGEYLKAKNQQEMHQMLQAKLQGE